MEACIWHLGNLVPESPEAQECLARMERQVFEASRILTEVGASYTAPEPAEATKSASASLT